MKKIVIRSIIMISALFSFEGLVHAQNYWDGTADKVFAGSGTESDPYLITSAQELAGLAVRTNVDKEDFSGKYLKLTQDIWLTDFTDPDTANWKEWEPIAHSLMQWNVATDYGYFCGHFDGDGHTVYNLYYGKGMNWADDWDPLDLDLDLNSYDFSVMNKALFVNLDGGTIENLNMANAKMAGVNQALLVLNVEANSVVRNCHVEGEIRGTQSSCNGLVYNNKGLIENCSATVNTNLQGGAAFVGTNEATGVIRNCTSAGFMRCTMGAGAGFVSSNLGLIEKCTANVHVQALGGPDAQTNEVGGHTFRYRSGAGFVLENSGTIRECAALGNLDAEGTSANYVWSSAIAGFAYRNWNGRIESSYCTGALHDVSDSTGVGGDPIMAMFCYNNGENAQHVSDDAYRGDIYNCYTTSTIRHHDANYYRNSIHPFVGIYHDFGGFNGENQGHVEPSQQIGCFFANEGLPAISEQSGASWNGVGKPLADMQTQAFVDELNSLAAFLGTSQWELRDGLPRPTGVYLNNTAALLGGGEGTKNNPYLISTKQHLENLALLCSMGMTFHNQYIKQTADITLNAPMSEWEYTMPTQWKPIASPNTHPYYSTSIENYFRGTYDGDFHKVENMYINSLTSGNYGLFSYVGKNGIVRNLKVTDAYIRANGNIGILSGYIGESARIIQCHTSGDVAWKSDNGANIGGLTGELGSDGLVLNCSSGAQMVGGGAYNGIGIVHGSSFHVWAQDTCINFLFTGNINNGEKTLIGSSYAGFQYNENEFIDREKHVETASGTDAFHGKETTAWLQSKEFVNLLNYGVSRWNACHDQELQLHYWQFNEGAYPSIAADAAWRPAVAITFNSTGGDAVPTKYVYDGSEALAPQRPLRDGYLFAGWYKDAGLTQFYEWKTERPTASLTLYARWREDQRWEVDITPFQNEFAKTYHIKTAAQLRGLMAMQNGLYDWGEKNDCGGSSNKLMYPTNPLSQTLAPVSFAGKTIVLDNDILLCDTTDWQYWGRGAFGLPWKSIGSSYGVEGEGEHPFKGTFDGQGHVIYGLYQENTGMPMRDGYGGFFGWVGDGAVIKNVGIAASCLDYQNYDTRGVYDDATKYWLQSGVATQGNPSRAGMMAGAVVDSVTFDQCYTEGNIFVQSAGFYGVGGFIGTLGDAFYYNMAKITNCYSRVDVYNTSVVDTIDYEPVDYGFAVLGKTIPVTQCYSAGHTWHSFANANNSYGDQVADCYYDKELVQVMDYYSWGGIHYIGNPKTTNEMHAKATYVDWDFGTIWGRNDAINDGYPYLRVFHEGAPADSEDPVLVTGITLNVTDTTIIAGNTLQLIATVLPENAVDKGFTWSVDESEWFSMDENGLITTYFLQNRVGQSATFTFTVTTNEGGYTATCKMKITQPKLEGKVIAKRRYGETEWQTISDGKMIENFEYMYLVYSIPNLSAGAISWSTDDESIFALTSMSDTIYNIYGSYVEQYNYTCARVIVRAKHAGSSIVRATSAIGPVLEKTWSPVLVEPSSLSIYLPPAQQGYYGLEYPQPDTQMGVGETQQLDVVMYGNCSGYYINSDGWSSGSTTEISYWPTIQWSSSNPSVLMVDETGLVTASSVGSATITAAAIGTELSNTTAEITVLAVEAQSIKINEYTDERIELREGGTFQLTATILPENTTDKTVTWSSGNTNYATVDNNGLVTAVKGSSYGNYVTIYARTANGRSASIYFKILDNPAQEVILNTHALELRISETFQLEAVVLPENASNKTVTWSAYSSTIASVDNTGLVTAKGVGTTQIIARVGSSGNYHYDTCQVTVKPHELILSDHELMLYVGDEYQLDAIIIPETTNITITWSSTSRAVASVNSTGMVTGNAVGNAQIVARIRSGSSYIYDTCQVTVVKDEPQPVYYTVRFLNYDGSLLQKTQVPEGEIPVYNGQEPTRPDDEEYSYEFTGWMPEVVATTTNVDYIAQFRAIVKDGVSDIPASGNSAPRKVLIDGQIFIVRGEKLYNLIGQEVK